MEGVNSAETLAKLFCEEDMVKEVRILSNQLSLPEKDLYVYLLSTLGSSRLELLIKVFRGFNYHKVKLMAGRNELSSFEEFSIDELKVVFDSFTALLDSLIKFMKGIKKSGLPPKGQFFNYGIVTYSMS